MKVCFFAHYDKTGHVHEYVIKYIQEILKYYDKVYFCSDGEIKDDISHLCEVVDCGRHCEYDFGSWKRCLQACDKDIDELLLANDSCFCLGDIKDLLPSTDKKWGGAFLSKLKTRHIQSYFVWFKKPLINKLKEFLLGVTKQPTKEDIILKYEVGMSKLFIEDYEPQYVGEILTPYTPKLLDNSPLLKKSMIVEFMWNKSNTIHFVKRLKEKDMIFDYMKAQGVI